ncbi:MAG TPA: hypothetical protein VE153_22150 [Myxococcus sp.]|nr:hypothetical protein [Myxococcus sp.]
MRLRLRTLLALACAASLSACSSDSEDPKSDPLPGGGQRPYDGPWTALPESGNWVDPGALAVCTVRQNASTCGDTASFDMSGCDTGSLAAVERMGAIYRAELRLDAIRLPTWEPGFGPGSGGFQFDASGQLVSVSGMGNPRAQVGPGSFIVSGAQVRDDGTQELITFAGCRAPGPRQLTGCYVRCKNGQISARGTFRAERMTWREGEAEASGGMRLLSESAVARGFPADVYVAKGHAYVVSLNAPRREGGLTVFDVSDPARPVQTASLALTNDSKWNGVWAKDDALYVASAASGVLVFDISNPAQPNLVRSLPGGGGPLNVHTVFVEGSRLYAMSPSPNAETLLFDLANPLRPQLLARYALGGAEAYPHDAFAYEGRLYINHGTDGFVIADVSGEQPVALGRYAYGAFSHANAVGTFNGRTVAFEGGEGLGAHLRVLDVTDPAAIARIGEFRLRGVTSMHNLVLVGTRLYIAWYHEGVRVLDVLDPSQPRQLAHFNTYRETDPGRDDGLFEGAIGMRVPGDGRVYVVDTSRGLLIFNEP